MTCRAKNGKKEGNTSIPEISLQVLGSLRPTYLLCCPGHRGAKRRKRGGGSFLREASVPRRVPLRESRREGACIDTCTPVVLRALARTSWKWSADLERKRVYVLVPHRSLDLLMRALWRELKEQGDTRFLPAGEGGSPGHVHEDRWATHACGTHILLRTWYRTSLMHRKNRFVLRSQLQGLAFLHPNEPDTPLSHCPCCGKPLSLSCVQLAPVPQR